MKYILFYFCFLTYSISFSQDYSTYYKLINEAEESFVINRDSSCYKIYDQAFENFQPFLKDPYIASQIALHLGDTIRFYHYLKTCFINGMPLTAVESSPLISKSKLDTKYIRNLYNQTYVPKDVDEKIQTEICLKCYQSDSIKLLMEEDYTLNQKYNDTEDQLRKFLLDSFLVNGIFPNERLIGITSDSILQDFHSNPNHPDMYLKITGATGYNHEEFELRAKCPFNIVLHSKCFYRDNRSLFINAMLNGYCHPKEIGILDETAIIWHHNDNNPNELCNDLEGRLCYNIFGNNPMRPQLKTFTLDPDGLLEIEANRKEIFMQKYSIDLQKKQLENELGIKFFFDFKDR